MCALCGYTFDSFNIRCRLHYKPVKIFKKDYCASIWCYNLLIDRKFVADCTPTFRIDRLVTLFGKLMKIGVQNTFLKQNFAYKLFLK